MAEAEYTDVRVEESLRVKIGEAKNLPSSSFSGSARSTCCAIKIDSEEIFRTSTVEKSSNPFFGAEFQGEIPKKFRHLSFYVYEVGNKNKVLGKVSLKKEELYKYHQKEHWFPLTYQDSDTEVQGKVQIEVKLDEFLTPTAETSHRMTVRVLECSDLTVINGSCNPYAVVTLHYGKSKTKEVKKTSVKKKTICPQFEEKFYFYIDKEQNQEKSIYMFEDFMAGELSISLFHDDSKVSREVLGNMFKGSFLGEVKIPIHDVDISRQHKAWYCLQAKEQNRGANDQSLGSIRLKISYTADYVFPSKYYDGLRNLILESAETKPFTSSAVFILGEIVNHRESTARENAAQPLVKLFLHHGKLIPLVHALADWEMSNTVDPNTLFRGNSLLTKMVDELMKLTGLPYLHDTLKSFIDQVISEAKPCEIDPTRLKDGESLEMCLANLFSYVSETLNTIVSSGLVCAPIMRDVFSTLKSRAILNYPDNVAVRYHAVTSFIFLRFFTAAIMGPNLFDLYSDILEPCVQRTLTLISKGISGLVTLVSSKSNSVTMKEEYMAPLFEMFPKSTQADIKMFLDIISSSSGSHFKGIEAPIVLKEGYLIKRAQGRKRFGLKNFKRRFFRLTNQAFSYSKCRGDKHVLFEIPVTDVLAVERLEEESFKMKYMFQVIHAQRVLYIQASNCVEEKEWMDILIKICKSNKNRLKFYHPAAFVNNHWLCCKSSDPSLPGCKPVTGGLPLSDILGETGEIDSDREVEKIHSIFLSAIELLDALQETCGSQAVYSGDIDTGSVSLGANIEDPSSCFSTIAEIQRWIITLEQEHIQYMRSVQRRTVIGSIDTPIGDESNADLVRNMNRSSEKLSRHGSRSSNASNISRRSFRGCRSRGGSFRERDKGKLEGEGVRKSLSGDVACSSKSLGVDFSVEVKKAASYDVMATDSCSGTMGRRTQTTGSERRRDTVCSITDNSIHVNCVHNGESGVSSIDVGHHASEGDSADVRVPKHSTGFVPSAFINNENHEDFMRQMNGESFSITPEIRDSLVLSRISSSSQNVGVLETCLDSETVTTTINLTDHEDLKTVAGEGCGDSRDVAGNNILRNNQNPQVVRSNLDVLACQGGTDVQETLHKPVSEGLLLSSCATEDMSFVGASSQLNDVIIFSDAANEARTSIIDTFTSSYVPSVSYCNQSCSESSAARNFSGEDIYTFLKEAGPASKSVEKDTSSKHSGSVIRDRVPQHLTAEHGEANSPPTQCVIEGGSSVSSDSYSSKSQGFSVNKYSVPMSQPAVTPHLNQNTQVYSSVELNQPSCSSSVVVSSCEGNSLRTGNEGRSCLTGNGVYILTHGVTEVVSGERAGSGGNNVKYSLPELTSSCRMGIEPQRSISIMTTESNSSTPALSPSDVATLEIMLTSAESDSSQEKL